MMCSSNGQTIVRELGLYTDLLALHRARPGRYPHLLQSAAQGTPQARFDILFAFPGASLRMERDGLYGEGVDAATDDGFLAALDRWWQQERLAKLGSVSDNELPFLGGWFLFLGYELAGEIEPNLRLPPVPEGLPVAVATRFPAAVITDHERRRTFLVAEAEQAGLIEPMLTDLNSLADEPADLPLGIIEAPGELGADAYVAGVARVKHYIVEGDVFQVNLSHAWRGRLAPGTSPAALYTRLRRRNPAPFAGLASLGKSVLISSSPERLVRVSGDLVETRPIAGTRPRSAQQDADGALSRELLAHPKERAEHIMLIDLERNDLGRLCRPGTVKVSELMVLESYAHVHHIVSNVQGRLRDGITPGQVIRAVFPGGTITGCPKVRCMEIIASLEGEGRGAYTGSMGYLNRNGDMDLNILIRTLVMTGDRVSFRAGAGLVADSEPGRELEETRHKAKGLLLALGSGEGI